MTKAEVLNILKEAKKIIRETLKIMDTSFSDLEDSAPEKKEQR